MCLMRITPLDLQNALPAELDAWHELKCFVNKVDSPGDTVPSRAETVGELFDDENIRKSWFAWENEQLIGGVTLCLYGDGNQHFAELSGCVHPEFRRRGIGADLLHTARNAAIVDNRTVLATHIRCDSNGSAFLRKAGMMPMHHEMRNVLRHDSIDLSEYQKYASGETVRSRGYELVHWINECPEELANEFVDALDSTNDIPVGDLDWRHLNYSLDWLHRWQQGMIDRGKGLYLTCVREKASGTIVAVVAISAASDSPTGYVEFTAGRKSHRGLGLGLWMKAASILHFLDQAPHITEHDTFNAHTNVPMLSINEKLGYQPAEDWHWLQMTLQ